MPANIPELAKPIEVRPFFADQMRFPHAFVQKPGDVRYGLVWFGQLPGFSNTFVAVHQTGKIWLLEKNKHSEPLQLDRWRGLEESSITDIQISSMLYI